MPLGLAVALALTSSVDLARLALPLTLPLDLTGSELCTSSDVDLAFLALPLILTLDLIVAVALTLSMVRTTELVQDFASQPIEICPPLYLNFFAGRDTAVVTISKAFDFLVHQRYPLGTRFSNAHTHKDARAMPRTLEFT